MGSNSAAPGSFRNAARSSPERRKIMLCLCSPVNRLPFTKQHGQPNIFFWTTPAPAGASSSNIATSSGDDFSHIEVFFVIGQAEIVIQYRASLKRARNALRTKRRPLKPHPGRLESLTLNVDRGHPLSAIISTRKAGVLVGPS